APACGLGSEGAATVTGCTFTGNQSIETIPGGAADGAIDNGPAGPLIVSNCTFIDNLAISDFQSTGGGISSFAPSTTITNTTFINNQAIAIGPGGTAY